METHFCEAPELDAMLIQVEFRNSTSTEFQTTIYKVTIMLSFKEMVLINTVCFLLLFCVEFLFIFLFYFFTDWLIGFW